MQYIRLNFSNYMLLREALIKQTKCTKVLIDCARMVNKRFLIDNFNSISIRIT